MAPKTITKTVHQYNAQHVPPETMEKLLAIAQGYRAVKNRIYRQYSGIRSLGKLYPGYTVQNEMTKSGFRQQLSLPGAYFYPAIFEALVDIRNLWDREKSQIGQRVRQNVNFSEADRHYLLYILSLDKAFAAVLNRRPIELPAKLQKHYRELASPVDEDRLGNYLRRQARKIHARPRAGEADRFSVTGDGYRYADHGLYLATQERRQRMFIPLTDSNTYRRQLDIRLCPDKNGLVVQAPIEVRVRRHTDYLAQVGLAMGMNVMFTTDEGHTYGEDIASRHREYSAWLRDEQRKYQQNRLANPGRKKHEAAKRRREGQLHSYINHELNRLLTTEKPQAVYLMKFPAGNRRYGDKAVSHAVNKWQRGYIRRQLQLKCREHEVEFVEVPGRGIADECSRCGNTGRRENGMFICACGHHVPEKQNVAQNAKQRGLARP